jgi:hypothetical protein
MHLFIPKISYYHDTSLNIATKLGQTILIAYVSSVKPYFDKILFYSSTSYIMDRVQ